MEKTTELKINLTDEQIYLLQYSLVLLTLDCEEKGFNIRDDLYFDDLLKQLYAKDCKYYTPWIKEESDD